MNRIAAGIALGVIASAGAAQGQFTYPINGFSGTEPGLEVSSIQSIRWDGNAVNQQFSFGESSSFFSFNQFLTQPTRTEISETIALDTTAYPSIDRYESSKTFAGETSDTRLEISWDTEYWVDLTDTPDLATGNPFVVMRPVGQETLRGSVLRFDEDTRIRISFDTSVGGTVGAGRDFGTAGAVDNSVLFSFDGDAIPNAFTAGAGEATDLGSSFVVEFDVLAGADLNIGFTMDNDLNRPAILDDGLRHINQWNRGSLVIEVVPAPASAGVLAMGGLVAVRRRR